MRRGRTRGPGGLRDSESERSTNNWNHCRLVRFSTIMRRVSGRHQTRSAASSTPSTTSSDITEHFPPERWVRPLYASVFFFFSLIARTSLLSSGVRTSAIPEGFACLESRFGYFRTIIHDPSARVAAISAIDKEIDEQHKAVDEHLREVDAARQLFHSQLAHHNALTPIFVLPPEVLAWVFHFLVFEDPACSRGRNLGRIRATFAASGVKSR